MKKHNRLHINIYKNRIYQKLLEAPFITTPIQCRSIELYPKLSMLAQELIFVTNPFVNGLQNYKSPSAFLKNFSMVIYDEREMHMTFDNRTVSSENHSFMLTNRRASTTYIVVEHKTSFCSCSRTKKRKVICEFVQEHGTDADEYLILYSTQCPKNSLCLSLKSGLTWKLISPNKKLPATSAQIKQMEDAMIFAVQGAREGIVNKLVRDYPIEE